MSACFARGCEKGDPTVRVPVASAAASAAEEDPVRFDFVLARRGMWGETVDFSHRGQSDP